MKLAIIIGHDKVRQGAKSYNGVHEWSYYMDLVYNHLEKRLLNLCQYHIFWREPGDYRTEVQKLSEKIIQYAPDYSIELHFNAFDGRTPIIRSEILTLKENNIGLLLQENMKLTFKLESNGSGRYQAKSRTPKRGDRGYVNLKLLQEKGINAVLFEPFFGDVETRVSKKCLQYPNLLADVIYKSISEHLEGK